jgi:cardiolipin synthase C
MKMKWLRIAKWTVGSFFGLIALVYLVFYIALKITSSGIGFPKEAQDAVYAESKEPHQIQLIDSGILSLKERLNLIASAKETLELEFFIFNIDQASRLVTHALIQKASEGVKVRLLVDFSAPVFQLRPAYAQLMKNSGIEIKYYNTTPLYRLFSIQHRSHRKLVIVDGKTVLSGGRNIGDDYFDLSSHYNFLDSDIRVEGPIVKTVRSSFDLYWNSEFASLPESLEEKISSEELNKALAYLKVSEDDMGVLKKLEDPDQLGKTLPPVKTCSDMIFVTDFPERGEAHRKIYPTIIELISKVQKEVLVESPYFVIRDDGRKALASLGDRGIKLQVLTNGLYSTDAYYVISALKPRLQWIADTGLDLFVYNGQPLATDPGTPASHRWGIHAKRAVLDRQTVLLGTYNIDPRSANLNSEVMFVCRNNPEFAELVLQSMGNRLRQSTLLLSQKKVVDEEALMKNAEFSQKMMVFLAYPIATLFDILL